MPRTTVDIDAPILRELERLAAREGKSLGRVISELLAPALARLGVAPRCKPLLAWQFASNDENPLHEPAAEF